MQLRKVGIAAAAIVLFSALPAGAQTTVTMEAESMTLSSYAVDNGTRIKLTSSSSAGTASKGFSGASGTYNMQVHVLPENDGQSTLEVYKGATRLRTYTYPLSTSATSFTISNVALNSGEAIKLIGKPSSNGNALARVDRIVFTSVATSTPTTGTPTTGTTPGTTTPTTPIIGDAVGA